MPLFSTAGFLRCREHAGSIAAIGESGKHGIA